MNCNEFENLIGELARQRMMKATARDAALAHAEACCRCQARLADERALSAGLKALTASDERKTAPAFVETALLAAFHRQPSLDRQPSFKRASRWPRWAWAAAAAILLAFGAILFNAMRSGPSSDETVLAPPSPSPQPSIEAPVKPEERVGKSPPSLRKRAAQMVAHRGRKSSQAAPFVIREEMTLYAEDSETTTDFLPLDYNQNPSPMESGRLIRVQMPRSALVRFGLPVHVERVEAPVKADLLVGEDGLARAIRFVR
jgi:hypothetical protein